MRQWMFRSVFLLLCIAVQQPLHAVCDPPILLSVDNLTTTSAELDWTAVGSETSWDVAVVPAGSPAPSGPTLSGVANHPLLYTGLVAGKAYDFYVRAVCGSQVGSWAKYNGSFITHSTNPSTCGLGLAIPDNDCTSLTVEVTTAPGTQLGVDVYLQEVRLIVQHPWDADLDISLESPSGILLDLSSDNGGQQDNYGDVEDASCMNYSAFGNILEASSCSLSSIEEAQAPFIGTYLPESPLHQLNDASSPLGNWVLHLCDDAQDDEGVLLYVELVFASLLCAPPVEPFLDLVDSTFVQLSWTPGANCVNTFIEYGPAGFTPGTGTTVMTGCPPQLVTGLQPNTLYDFYLSEDCGGGQVSSRTCPLSVQTLCSPPQLTLVENFDGQSPCSGLCEDTCSIQGVWRNLRTDEMDWLVGSGSTPTVNTGPDDDFSGGGQYAYMEASGLCYSTYRAILESNCLDINAVNGDCHMSFRYYMYGAGVDELELLISTDAGMSWQLLWSLSGDQGQQWLLQNIDLSAYDGQTARFRFVAHKGFQAQGDIALDEIRFYGALDLGPPDYVFYKDLDGDQYGSEVETIQTCAALPPSGYVATGGDCDDTNPDIHPNQPETPCDGIDSNCNGMLDESELPPPVAQGDTICSGEVGNLQATPAYFGEIYWYDAPTGGNLLHQGSNWTLPDTFENQTSLPKEFTFFAEELNFVGCVSGTRAAVSLVVNPLPEIEIAPGQFEASCAGTSIDLSNLVIQDIYLLNPTFTYHSAYPPSGANELPSPVVTLSSSATFYVQAEADGCFYTDSLDVEVLPSPIAHIQGDTAFCEGSSQLLLAQDLGEGVEPLTYLWSTGATTPDIEIDAGTPGSTVIYTLQLTGANACSSNDTLVVETVQSIAGVSFSATAVSVCGGSDGIIWLSPNGGVAPYSYDWTGPTGQGDTSGIDTLILFNLPQGAYYFTVTDASPDACSFVLPPILVQGPQANVVIDEVQNPSCYGMSDGCISLTALSGSPTYLWSTGDTTAQVCGLPAGSYTVSIADGSCVWELGPVVLSDPDSLILKPGVIGHASCYASADGSVLMFASGGLPPYELQWSNGSTGNFVDSLVAGSYAITLTDAAGCQKVLDSILISEPAPLEFSLFVQPPICYGEESGSITLIVQGGQLPYSYAWSNGSQSPQLVDLGAGTYGCTVTDGNGCAQDTFVVLTQPDSLFAETLQLQNPSCAGAADGLIQLQAVGGTAPFVFSWLHGAEGSVLQDLPQGYYSVLLSDAYGCLADTQTYVLTSPPGIQAEALLHPPSCLGYADGAIDLQLLQGTAPFTFYWNTGDTTQSIADLPQGNYQLTLVDALGCMDTLEFFLEADQPMNYSFSAFAPNCHGASNGMVFLAVFGGQQPYLYSWSNGDTTAVLENVPAATYSCTVTDAQGCMLIVDSISLTDFPPIVFTLEAMDSVSCAGASDGAIHLSVTGGVPPYLYTWSNEEVTENLLSVPAGSYQLTVLDSVQCAVSSQWFTLPEPPLLTVDLLAFEQQGDCVINDVDSLVVQVAGGTGSIDILWNTGYTGDVLAPAPPGEYSVTVIDEHACTASSAELKVPELRPALELISLPIPFDTALCAEVQTSGSLQVLIEGGHEPWQYHWSFGLAGTTTVDTLLADSLAQGVYQITVTDNNGCVAVLDSLPLVLPQPLFLSPDQSAIQHISCKGDSTGTLGVQIVGGLPPYTFSWRDTLGQEIADVQYPQMLPAGVYELWVSDARLCTAQSGPYTLLEPEDSLAYSLEWQGNFCFGDSTGWIAVSIQGGEPPYDLVWTDGATASTREMLPAGWYGFVLTDAVGCVLTLDSFYLWQPEQAISLLDYTVTNPLCAGSNEGAIDITVEGGTPPYDFIWSNGTFLEDPLMLAAGSYYCIIVDSLSCVFQTPDIVLSAPPPLVIDSLIQGAHPGQANGQILVMPQGGVPPYSYLWDTGDTTALLEMLPAGIYELTCTDAHGCSVVQSFEVPLLTSWSSVDTGLFFGLSPNPTRGFCRLSYLGNENSTLHWQLYDLQGRLRFETLLRESAENQILSLGHLPKGIYFWKLKSEKGLVLKAGKLILSGIPQ